MRVAYVYAATDNTHAGVRPPACGSRLYSLAECLDDQLAMLRLHFSVYSLFTTPFTTAGRP